MKRLILLALVFQAFLFLSPSCFGQTYNFQPEWKKGQKKKIEIIRTEKDFVNDELESEATYSSEASIHVLNVTDEKIKLEILFENIALQKIVDFYDRLGEEMGEYRTLKLIYEVDKKTLEADLINWEESKEFMDKSYEKIRTIFEEKVPDMAPMLGLVLGPLQRGFNNKENMEEYMQPRIEYLFSPFHKDFRVQETIAITESADNPFSPGKKTTSVTKFTLQQLDKASQTCEIEKVIEIDLTEYREMMRSLMESFSSAFEASDSTKNAMGKEIDELEFDMGNQQLISFDYNSTWVTKVVTKVTVLGTVPGEGKKRSEIISEATIKDM